MLLETHRDDVREGGPQAPTRRPSGLYTPSHSTPFGAPEAVQCAKGGVLREG